MGNGYSTQGIVVVGNWRTKGGVEIAALVPGGQLDERAIIAIDLGLHPANVALELVPRAIILIILQSLKAQKEGGSRTQFGKKAALFTL